VSSAQILAALGNGLFVATMLTAAVRVLLLWRRTRQLPELAVGAGFLLTAGVGFPLMIAGGIGRVPCGDLSLPWVGVGILTVGIGLGALNVFTWKVFAPDRPWAAGLALGSFAVGLGIAVGAVLTLARAPAHADPIEAGTFWWMGLRMGFQVWYVWTAVASLREWTRARRRVAMGLSDPVVANRLLLWGAMGAFQALDGAVAMALEQSGRSPVHDPISALVLAANGIVSGGLILLTFMPPRSYLRFVRGRAALASAP
jgi:hypothetical protein